jgi:hypothetical protein
MDASAVHAASLRPGEAINSVIGAFFLYPILTHCSRSVNQKIEDLE